MRSARTTADKRGIKVGAANEEVLSAAGGVVVDGETEELGPVAGSEDEVADALLGGAEEEAGVVA